MSMPRAHSLQPLSSSSTEMIHACQEHPVAFSPSGTPTWGAPIPATATLTVNKPDSVAAHQTADLTVDQVGNMNPFYSSGTLGFIRGYLSYPAPAVS